MRAQVYPSGGRRAKGQGRVKGGSIEPCTLRAFREYCPGQFWLFLCNMRGQVGRWEEGMLGDAGGEFPRFRV